MVKNMKNSSSGSQREGKFRQQIIARETFCRYIEGLLTYERIGLFSPLQAVADIVY
jgi:hypothetical protein